MSGEQISLALGEVSALLRAGLPPPTAWQPLLGEVSGPVDRAIERWASGQLGEDQRRAQRIAAVHRLSGTLGVPAADLLDGCVRAFDADARAADARLVALAGPRASARVLLALPLLGLLLGVALGADPIGTLLDGGIGTALLLAGMAALGAGWLWSRTLLRAAAAAPDDPEPVALELLGAAVGAGAAVPAALAGAGEALGGHYGHALAAIAGRLTAGANWERAWRDQLGTALERALAPAWRYGVAPGPMLAARAERAHQAGQRRAAVMASRLGVRMLLPLGLCYLPAFALLGLAPVILSLLTDLLAS